jgi:hypothetical protein
MQYPKEKHNETNVQLEMRRPTRTDELFDAIAPPPEGAEFVVKDDSTSEKPVPSSIKIYQKKKKKKMTYM